MLCRSLPVFLILGTLRSAASIVCNGKTMLRAGGLSCQHKQNILDEHNRLRQLVALGQVPGLPTAANMMEMVWDDDLATAAQKWTELCDDYPMPSIPGKLAIGRNIAQSCTADSAEPHDVEPEWRKQIYGWFNDGMYFRSGSPGYQIKNFQQLVRDETYLVGCGYSYYYDPVRGYIKNYVCQYGPSGSVDDLMPYQTGRPICNNYGVSYSNRYSGLCSVPGSYHYLGAYCMYG